RLGGYAYRTLPTRPASKNAIELRFPRTALTGVVRARAAERWGAAKKWLLDRDAEAREKHGGRAPDFGDAQAIVACVDAVVDRRLAVLGDLESVTVGIDAEDDGLRATATLAPPAGGGPATQRFDGM